MNSFIAFGSNLGDRLHNLSEAKQKISTLPNITLFAASPIYETDPVGCPPETKSFFNAVVQIETSFTPLELLSSIQHIEEQMGRAKSRPKNVPRRIDLDLLCCGDLILRDAHLTLPHPELTQRRFVLQPLADIAPDFVIAGTRKTVRELLAELKDAHGVKRFADKW